MALLPPPSFQTCSPLTEPVASEFKLWREGVRYTAKYDINYLLRPTLDLKKNHRIVIYRSSSSGNPNSHLSQILIDAHPRLKEAVANRERREKMSDYRKVGINTLQCMPLLQSKSEIAEEV